MLTVSEVFTADNYRARSARNAIGFFSAMFGPLLLAGGVLLSPAVAALGSDTARHQLYCRNAVSAAEQITNRARVENAVLSLARNSNEDTIPSAYRPDSDVERAIARVRRDCFARFSPAS